MNTKERSIMNRFDSIILNHDACVENLAAELTDAAYPVALRHGVAGSSIEPSSDRASTAPRTPSSWGWKWTWPSA